MFATITHMEQFLQVKIHGDGLEAAKRALREATAAIREYTKQHLSLVEDATITLDSLGTERLYLPELPVNFITSVTENGTLLSPGVDYDLGGAGILYRKNRRWARGYGNIEIIYTHGYNPIPQTIVDICTRAAARGYQAGLRAKNDDGVLGVNSKSLGDFSVAYGSEHGGGVGDGLMGASAARMLLMSEKDALNRYKI